MCFKCMNLKPHSKKCDSAYWDYVGFGKMGSGELEVNPDYYYVVWVMDRPITENIAPNTPNRYVPSVLLHVTFQLNWVLLNFKWHFITCHI